MSKVGRESPGSGPRKLAIGTRSATREIVGYTGNVRKPYVIRCLTCLSDTHGNRRYLDTQCQSCVLDGRRVDPRSKVIRQYRYNAESRGFEFSIDDELAFSLIEGNCHYCGDPPYERWSGLCYNGIDRIVNDCGYVPGNVVSCCAVCNIAKADLTVVEFAKKITKIYERLHLWQQQ